MNLPKAKQIIKNNYKASGYSLIYYLHEECVFSEDAYWELIDAIIFLVRNGIKEEALITQIAIGYQAFLKEMIWHNSPGDAVELSQLPENSVDYIERLDRTVRAYLENAPQWADSARFDLQKEMF